MHEFRFCVVWGIVTLITTTITYRLMDYFLDLRNASSPGAAALIIGMIGGLFLITWWDDRKEIFIEAIKKGFHNIIEKRKQQKIISGLTKKERCGRYLDFNYESGDE